VEHRLVGPHVRVGRKYGRAGLGVERGLCWTGGLGTLLGPEGSGASVTRSSDWPPVWGTGRALVVVEPLLSLWGWW
jgi:hypothetical protein